MPRIQPLCLWMSDRRVALKDDVNSPPASSTKANTRTGTNSVEDYEHDLVSPLGPYIIPVLDIMMCNIVVTYEQLNITYCD